MKPTQILLLLLCSPIIYSTPLFKANSFQASFNGAISAASGDINGDGFNDVVLATTQKGHVLLYLNDQQSGFIARPFNLRRSIAQVDLADMNGDGVVDLLVYSTAGEAPASGTIRRGTGTGSLFSYLEVFFSDGSAEYNMTQPNFTFGTNGQSHAFKVADFNQDGFVDVFKTVSRSGLAPNQTTYSSQIYMGGAGFSFEPMNTDVNLQFGSRLADFNQDGYLDIWNLSGVPKVHVYDVDQGFWSANSELVYFEPREAQDPNIINPTIESFSRVSLGDLDGDGDIDVQAFTHKGEFYRYLKAGNRFVPTGLNTELPLPFEPIDQYHSSRQYGALIDVYNDGKLSTWVGSYESEQVLLVGDSAVLTDPDVQVLSIESSNRLGDQVLVDDFSADGWQDVVSIGANGLLLWENQSGQGWSRKQTDDGRWGLKSIIKTGMLNGDDYADVAVAGKNGISIKHGNGLGALGSDVHITYQAVEELLLADLNGDGQDDILGLSSNQIHRWQKGQNETFEQTTVHQAEGKIKRLIAHDLNHDGRVDLSYINDEQKLITLENSSHGFQTRVEDTGPVLDYAVTQQGGFDELVLFTNRLPETSAPGVLVYRHADGEGLVLVQALGMDDFSGNSDPLFDFFLNGHMRLVDVDFDGDLDVSMPHIGDFNTGLYWLINDEGQWQPWFMPSGASDLLPFALEFADFNADGVLDVFGALRYANFDGPALPIDHISMGSVSGFSENQPMAFDLATADSELVDLDGDGDLDLVQISQVGEVATQLNTQVDLDFSGLWYSPEESGHGLQLEHIDLHGNRAINFSWFAYHQGAPFWLVGVAELSGNTVRIPLSYTTGTGFGDAFNSAEVNTRPWGFVDLVLTDHELEVSWQTSEPGFTNGSQSMQRLAAVKPTSRQVDVINSCHSGSWYNAEQSGHGFFTDVIEVGGETQMTLAWYHYLEGQQHWLVAQGPVFGNLALLTAYSGTGGEFPPNFDASEVDNNEWGKISFNLLSDSTAKITWSNTSASFPAGDLLIEKLTVLDRYRCN